MRLSLLLQRKDRLSLLETGRTRDPVLARNRGWICGPPAYRYPERGLRVIFVIIGHDGPDGQEKRKLHRQAHLDRMEVLDKAGKVLLAGPFTDHAGSLIVLDMPSLEDT